MPNPLARKLARYTPLSDADQLWLAEALVPERSIAPRTDIVHEGDDPRAVNVILDGWACRYRQLSDGRRQIVALLLPGDLCDLHVFLLNRMDHSIGALTPVTLVQISGTRLQTLAARSPALERAFHREGLATAAIQREWTVSLGSRTGIERMAHLFLELHMRMRAVGLADGNVCPLPLTQSDLAEALGQSNVHVNRTLQELRSAGLLSLGGRRLIIHDFKGLVQLAQFDPAYLHHRVEEDRS